MPHYGQMDQKARIKDLITMIGNVFRFKGQVSDAADTADIALNLDRKLSQSYPEVTLAEIKLAFDYGVTGEYGDYYGINFVTLFNFIKSYMENPERLGVISTYNQQQRKALPAAPRVRPLTNDEKIRRAREHIKEYHHDCHSLGHISATLHSQEWLYGFLRNNGIMPEPSREDLKEALDTAEKWLKEYKSSPFRNFLETIDDARDKEQGTTDDKKVNRKAKSILLTGFLASLPEAPEI